MSVTIMIDPEKLMQQAGTETDAPCFLCNTNENSLNIDFTEVKTSLTNQDVLSVMTSILGDRLVLHSTVLCLKCYSLVDHIDGLQLQLKLKSDELKNLYFNTRNIREEVEGDGEELSDEEAEELGDEDDGSDSDYGVKKVKIKTEDGIKTEGGRTKKLGKRSSKVAQEVKDKRQKFKLVGGVGGVVTAEAVVKGENDEEESGDGGGIGNQTGGAGVLGDGDDGSSVAPTLNCTLCNKVYAKEKSLKVHLLRKHKMVQCSKCPQTFASRLELRTHRMVCTGHKSRPKVVRQCLKCAICFPTRRLLLVHTQKCNGMGGEVSDETDKCPVCELEISGGDAGVAQHLTAQHGVARPWMCKVCSKTFCKQPELLTHSYTHTGERPFQCEECGARFSQKPNLRTHRRTVHDQEKRYACTYCSARYSRKRLLDCHINSKHTFNRPFKCSLCPSAFMYPDHLRRHEKLHRTKDSGSLGSAHVCPKCNRLYKNVASLSKHNCKPGEWTTDKDGIVSPKRMVTGGPGVAKGVLVEGRHQDGVFVATGEIKEEIEMNMAVESISSNITIIGFAASEAS